MMLFAFFNLLCTVGAFASAAATQSKGKQPFSLQVDLGYSIYRGYHNDTSKLNIFKGIRFAKAPTGRLRWQPPEAPTTDCSKTKDAKNYPLQCPQNDDSLQPLQTHIADEAITSEDCLFLNVWSPNVTKGDLPVMVWIHGGGYGMGNGRYDFSPLINTNNQSFVGVSIQYRLGAFGFLSSDEVQRKGVPNAGLLDQHFALQWVQKYIHLFGGDASKVTIAGESAGAGSVMLQSMAYGGGNESSNNGGDLFVNAFGASPYLPPQHGYRDWIPSSAYYAFASAAGCNLYNATLPVFACLQKADSKTLVNASRTVSQSGSYGSWAFVPVTDGTFVRQLPSKQLSSGKIRGMNGLSGNNANEGFIFVPPKGLETEKALVEYLKITFPLFSEAEIDAVLQMYPLRGPINKSAVASGQQQRANIIYGEATIICPSYWLAEAYSRKSASCDGEGKGYKYQFAVSPAIHAEDLPAYFPTGPSMYPQLPADFSTAFQKMLGNFVVHSNPSVSNLAANGIATGNSSFNPMSSWPPHTEGKRFLQINLNTTCPEELPVPRLGLKFCLGGQNRFDLVDADTWEDGRGQRCEFWKMMGNVVPEK